MFSNINDEILSVYLKKKKSILDSADEGNAEECMRGAYELWMFMNRFRNCDLQIYFDEEIQNAIMSLNKKRFDTSALLKEKNVFRIAYVLGKFSNTGGASVPHRFMSNARSIGGCKFEHFVLVTNLSDEDVNYNESEGYKHLVNNFEIHDFKYLEKGMQWLEKGEYIQKWLHERKIDFLVLEACPASIYAIASKPVVSDAVLRQDCYTYTMGPGVCDYTFLVTTDQVFKYKFKKDDSEKRIKNLLLPLHASDYVESARPLTREQLGIPDNTVLSGSTNIWKSCFGDSETLLKGIAELIRKHPNYHHVFAGTPRCLDNIEYFLAKNPDVKDNMHYINIVPNIYSLLKLTDFWVNSFPTSGGSDIEIALLGKPTIEFLANRNLNLHGCEFLRSRECEVLSLDEFVELGDRFIKDKDYRDDLGAFLKKKIIREFDKSDIIHNKIYGTFVNKFFTLLGHKETLPGINIEDDIEYEKCIAFYNSYAKDNWTFDRRWSLLTYYRKLQPQKSFTWIKSFEEMYVNYDEDEFNRLINELPSDLKQDVRVSAMVGMIYTKLAKYDNAFECVRTAIKGEKLNYILLAVLQEITEHCSSSKFIELFNTYCCDIDSEKMKYANNKVNNFKSKHEPIYYNY